MDITRDTGCRAVYEQCLHETVAQSGKFLQRVIRRAVRQMRLQVAAGTQDDMREAAVALMRAQDRLCTLYQRALARSVQAPAQWPEHGMHEAGNEAAQLGEVAARTAHDELARLDTLACAAGFAAHSNPLRPAVHARCLHDALQGVPATQPQMRAQWVAHLGTAMGDELRPLYDVLARKLHGRGVREESALLPQTPPRLAAWALAHELSRPAPPGACR
ncbi:MAG: hypothetical protein V4864_18425 [Pseudomonadota bacterium]